MRDAVFGRQRYWGEPIPIYYDENGIPKLIEENGLPLLLPEIDRYKPTETGEPPLARAADWKYKGKYEYEKSTMPGWAGSSWYFLRFKDPKNATLFCDSEADNYWGKVDLYVGGAEHATGHLLYSRFWNKFLKDKELVTNEEPYERLVNQGMIQGQSALIYRIAGENKFVSAGLKQDFETTELHVDISLAENDILDLEGFKKWRSDFADFEFICETDGKFRCGRQAEKMSKRWYNVVNPDDVIDRYGADTLRMYEMFLGPLTQSKPWDMQGIDGVSKFLRKLWRLFQNKAGEIQIGEESASPEELKVLHRTIKKIGRDIECESFNTSVSEFMIAINELTALKCRKRSVLEPILIILSPFAPHITEELWEQIGHSESIFDAKWPAFEEKYLKEDTIEYPVMINGKLRTKIEFSADAARDTMETEVLANEIVQKWLDGKPPEKLIIVPKKIVNVVI